MRAREGAGAWSRRKRAWRMLLTVLPALLVLMAVSTAANGLRGSVADRLDWPGSATDRYLDGDEVAAVLHAAAAKISACASGNALPLSSAEPTWLVFGVGPQGRAMAAATRREGEPNGLELCLLSVLSELDFGEHDGPPGSYSYPVVLHATGDAVRNLPYPMVLSEERPLRLPLLSVPLDLPAAELDRIEARLGPGR